MARAQTPQQVIEDFMVRARRIAAHSLICEQPELMEQLQASTFKFTVTVNHRTGEQSAVLRFDLPPEEAMESLASRVRPLTLSGDPLYFGTVLDALESVVGAKALDEWIEPTGGANGGSRPPQSTATNRPTGSVTALGLPPTAS